MTEAKNTSSVKAADGDEADSELEITPKLTENESKTAQAVVAAVIAALEEEHRWTALLGLLKSKNYHVPGKCCSNAFAECFAGLGLSALAEALANISAPAIRCCCTHLLAVSRSQVAVSAESEGDIGRDRQLYALRCIMLQQIR